MLVCENCEAGYLRQTGSFFGGEKWFYQFECSDHSCNNVFFSENGFRNKLGVKISGDNGMADEKILMAGASVANTRAFNKRVGEWLREVQTKGGKPFCETCARYDFYHNKLQDKADYETLTLVRETDILNKNQRSPLYGQIMGVMRDYKCKLGHGTSYEIEAAYLQQVKK
jgi:hypothetical protein